MKLLWQKTEEWWGHVYKTRKGDKEAVVFEDPTQHGRPTYHIKEDGYCLKTGFGSTMELAVQHAEGHLL